SLVIDEMKKMTNAPVTDNELNTSKRSYIERFPRNFDTKAKIVATFASDELTGRYAKDPQFWKTFRSNIDAVKQEDVSRVAQKYLTPEKFIILVVGNKADILLGHPNHPVKVQDLS